MRLIDADKLKDYLFDLESDSKNDKTKSIVNTMLHKAFIKFIEEQPAAYYEKYEDAEENGRILVLPCNTVWFIVDVNSPKHAYITSKSIRDLCVFEIEKIDIDGRYFSTREKAEKELSLIKSNLQL